MATEPGIKNLVKRAKKRDAEAFGEIYDRYVDQIFRYVYYKVGDYAEAQDLTGLTFLKAFENIDSYEFRDVAFSSWLYRIAHNLVVDHFRRQSRRETVSIEEHPQLPDQEGNPDEDVFLEMDFERLYDALSKLTHNQREVIILKFIENLSNSQVAEIMGISVGAVKSTQKRGLASLYRILRGAGEP